MKRARGGGVRETLLLNGQVLLTGGLPVEDAGSAAKPVELYNPRTRTFCYTGGTAIWEIRGATLLPNGKVLVIGGLDSSPENIAQLYDPVTGRFSTTGQMNFPRDSFSATLMANGKVLIAGGIPVAEVYDPAMGEFSISGTMSAFIASAVATELPSGDVLLVGVTAMFPASAIGEIYDLQTGNFLPPVKTIHPHIGGSGKLLLDGRVLIAGGSEDLGTVGRGGVDSELFTQAANTFVEGPRMTAPRIFQSAALLANGEVLLAGGSNDPCAGEFPPCEPFEVLKSAELYDPAQNQFTETGSMLIERVGHGVAALSDGTVLIAGGSTLRGTTLAEAELYTPPSMPVVKIVSPVNYSVALLGHPRIIYTQFDRTKAKWVDLYIDAKFLKPSPPFQFVWTPTTTGAHKITVKAYDCINGQRHQIGADAITVDVRP
jgi:hypothetical protein